MRRFQASFPCFLLIGALFSGCGEEKPDPSGTERSSKAPQGNPEYQEALERIRLVPEEEEELLVCRMDSAAKFERAERLKKELFSHLMAIEELEDGYAMKFPADEEMMVLIHEHVRTEWQCCPFFEFVLRYPSDHGPLEVHFKGGEKVKAMLRPKVEELRTALEKKG